MPQSASRPGSAEFPAQVLTRADVAESAHRLQQKKCQQHQARRPWRILRVIWLVVVAGLPIYYYLLPERDWNYEDWGAPDVIVVSRKHEENPWRGDEQIYSRIFIARPSAANMTHFRESAGSDNRAELLNELLAEYKLPQPYRDRAFHGHGWVDVVECGNGLILVADYSLNKGGLFSSRMTPETVWEHYPLHFIFLHSWASLGLLVLLLTPFLGIPVAMGYLLWRLTQIR